MRVLIVGAGPTGLGAARTLQEAGADWELYEAESWPGGLSASFVSDDYTWDLGGHILFSHYTEFVEALKQVMRPDSWIEHPRRSYIHYRDRWVPYPFQNNLRYLPDDEREACLRDLEAAELRRRPVSENYADFQSLLFDTMGAALARLFMVPYNAKAWAYPPSVLATQWLGDRVAIPDVKRIRRMIAEKRDDTEWGPNAIFRFPRQGGTGAIWHAMAQALPPHRLYWKSRVVAVDTDRHILRLADGREAGYDALVSTIPLTILVELTGLDGLRRFAGKLLHSSTHVIGMGFNGSPAPIALDKSWLYFGEAEYPFYRVTVFSNYSAANAPAGHHSFMAEVSESPVCPVKSAGLAGRCLDGLRRAGLVAADAVPVHLWQRRIEYSYPVPGLERDTILSELNPLLERRAIYSRGRFGAWKYEVGNMDHSFMQGAEIARRLLAGGTEVTLNSPDAVNRTVAAW